MLTQKLLPMDTQPFFVEYLHKDDSEIAEVKPCCQENNVFYYDIYIRNQYQFTVTPSADEEEGLAWKISLKNADKNIEPELINTIGQQIEKHLL
ncbi:MAG: hypothetical protein JWR87_3568 [Segetibacter sp.]|jgi:hypothetical protein|nr:hypothetical protein [Segetibacter sp.]